MYVCMYSCMHVCMDVPGKFGGLVVDNGERERVIDGWNCLVLCFRIRSRGALERGTTPTLHYGPLHTQATSRDLVTGEDP